LQYLAKTYTILFLQAMLLTNTLRKSVSFVALASVLAMTTGCQKEDLLEEQFSSPAASATSLHGQVIDGHYIVVFKKGNTGVTTSGTGADFSAERISAARTRQKVYEVSGIESSAVSQEYEGIVSGFAARLTDSQLAALRSNPDVAYIEQDRVISIGKTSKTNTTTAGKGSGKGSNKPVKDEPTPTEPAPTEPEPTEPAPSEPVPSEPAPTEPAPTDPAPSEPAPSEPAPSEPAPSEPAPQDTAPTEPAPQDPAPSEPAPSAPDYATITPLAGELVPWNIERIGYGDGTGKTVWVIDSGIDTDHPDLNVDLARSASFIYGNTSIEDGLGHGTSVAGVIAAKNNGSGMIGVAANATVVALRVFDDAGAGTLSRAINAVLHVSKYAKPGDVVNISLGSGMSTTLDDAVRTAAAKGIFFAIAAGNSATDCYQSSPARVDAPGVYTVSGMDIYNRLYSTSNYGASVDFAAPGANVTVTTKGGGIGGGAHGTSFAAPHVAGVLLLRGTVYSQGTITGDKDTTPDPIASVK
jgi:subtilisin family serine protease